jgi:hypothetical protein
MSKEEIHKIKQENDVMRYIIRETMWMARRYAHKRSTFAPGSVNECIMLAESIGINIEVDGAENIMYAEDGMLGKWNPDKECFEGE